MHFTALSLINPRTLSQPIAVMVQPSNVLIDVKGMLRCQPTYLHYLRGELAVLGWDCVHTMLTTHMHMHVLGADTAEHHLVTA